MVDDTGSVSNTGAGNCSSVVGIRDEVARANGDEAHRTRHRDGKSAGEADMDLDTDGKGWGGPASGQGCCIQDMDGLTITGGGVDTGGGRDLGGNDGGDGDSRVPRAADGASVPATSLPLSKQQKRRRASNQNKATHGQVSSQPGT